jgi:hypothetical protein
VSNRLRPDRNSLDGPIRRPTWPNLLAAIVLSLAVTIGASFAVVAVVTRIWRALFG